MLKAFNDVLNLVSVQLLAHDNAPEEWSVKDGRSLMRFYDGLVMSPLPLVLLLCLCLLLYPWKPESHLEYLT